MIANYTIQNMIVIVIDFDMKFKSMLLDGEDQLMIKRFRRDEQPFWWELPGSGAMPFLFTRPSGSVAAPAAAVRRSPLSSHDVSR
jgi:hypothetical protein